MSANIKVVVRPRPLDESKKEKWAPGFEVHGRRITLGAKTYDPDITTSMFATQQDMYGYCLPIIESVKGGCNGTIMVYGQTSTGKTHTMLGSCGAADGIAFQAMEDLIDHVRTECVSGRNMSLTLAMLEIYNEKVTDMLSETPNEVTLINGYPHEAVRVTLASMDDAVRYVRRGLERRHVSPTAMNDRSSRSHVILALDIAELDSEGKADVAHLFLVDLAGSENIKKSNVVGKAASEAGMINKSLLALKTVILTLSNTTEENSKPSHVPYRDSKLTLMLQDSIGGTARTMLVACVSPIGRDLEETKSTLEYASKARRIRNVANTERDKLAAKVRGMEVELQRLRNRLDDKIAERGGYFVSQQEHERLEQLKAENEQHKSDLATLAAVVEDAKANRNVMEGQAKMFKAMEEEARRELDVAKAGFLESARHIEETERATRDLCRVALREVDGAWAHSADTAAAALQRWHGALESPEFLHDFEPLVAEHCRNIRERSAAAFAKFVDLHKELAEKLGEVEAREAALVQGLRAELLDAVTTRVDSFARGAARAAADRGAAVSATGELVRLNAERSADPSNATGVRHMLEGLRAEVATSARPLMDMARTRPDAAAAAATEFHAKMDAATRRTVTDGLCSVASIPPPVVPSIPKGSPGIPLAPGGFASAGSSGALRGSTASGAGAPLSERENVGSAGSGRMKRLMPRSTTDSRDELLRRRQRRESSMSMAAPTK